MRGASGALGRNQFVDAIAEILENEVLVGRGLAVVDLLGPLLERQLDAERLVDGEGDIEEVEAVDLQIVDRVTFRLDVLTRDVAGFRNDLSHFIERSGHRACSFLDANGAATMTAPASPIAPGPSRS